jgi:single-strand DNA-binding protein
MNTLKNKVSLIGRVGKNPEIQNVGTAKDYSLVKVPLATNENYKDKNGQWHDNTQWHNLIAWGKTAERLSKMVTKGQVLMVEGRIVNKMYEKDGEKRYSTDIEVLDFLIISSKNYEKADQNTEELQTVK